MESTDLRSRLKNLTRISLDEIRLAQRSEYREATGPLGRRIVVFGAGSLGLLLMQRLKDTDVLVVGVADNSPAKQNTQVGGHRVMSAAEAAEQFGAEAAFVVAAYNGSAIRDQLRALSCACVVSFVTLFRAYPEQMMPLGALADPAPIWNESTEAAAALELLEDEESKRTFVEVIEAASAPRYLFIPRPNPPDQTYFAPDLVRLSERETFVDCGAYDGDAIRPFLDRTGGRFDAIVGIEPDPASFQKCREYVSSLPVESASRVEVFQNALSDRSRVIRFNAMGDVTSSADADGEIAVEAVRLDELLAGRKPTLIKMDIEGAEPEALIGAKECVDRSRPRLAVCTYHAIEHLWQIPLLMKKQWPDYKVYLRGYSEDMWETVSYGIPC